MTDQEDIYHNPTGDPYLNIGHGMGSSEMWWHEPGKGMVYNPVTDRDAIHPVHTDNFPHKGRIDHAKKTISFTRNVPHSKSGNISPTLETAVKSQLQQRHPDYTIKEFYRGDDVDFYRDLAELDRFSASAGWWVHPDGETDVPAEKRHDEVMAAPHFKGVTDLARAHLNGHLQVRHYPSDNGLSVMMWEKTPEAAMRVAESAKKRGLNPSSFMVTESGTGKVARFKPEEFVKNSMDEAVVRYMGWSIEDDDDADGWDPAGEDEDVPYDYTDIGHHPKGVLWWVDHTGTVQKRNNTHGGEGIEDAHARHSKATTFEGRYDPDLHAVSIKSLNRLHAAPSHVVRQLRQHFGDASHHHFV
jgi:hypothetical protein